MSKTEPPISNIIINETDNTDTKAKHRGCHNSVYPPPPERGAHTPVLADETAQYRTTSTNDAEDTVPAHNPVSAPPLQGINAVSGSPVTISALHIDSTPQRPAVNAPLEPLLTPYACQTFATTNVLGAHHTTPSRNPNPACSIVTSSRSKP